MLAPIRKFDDREVLSGAEHGKRTFARLVEFLAPAQHAGERVFIDFSGVEIATGSYLREAVLHLKNWCNTTNQGNLVVVANANALTLEELELAARLNSDAILACSLDSEGQPVDGILIGQLESKQREAFAFVQATGRATAQSLKEASDKQDVSPTAWNNRLNVLVNKGVIFGAAEGRSKVFFPVLSEVNHGC